MPDPNQSVTPVGFPQMGWPMALPFTSTQAAARPVPAPPVVTPNAMPASPQDPALAAQAAADRARIGGVLNTGVDWLNHLGAAAADIGTMPVRGVMGAANTLLRIPNAFGASIPYIPDNGVLTSMTPFSDSLDAARPVVAPSSATSAQPSAQLLDTTAVNRAEVQPQAMPDIAFRGQPPLLQAAPATAAEPAEDTAPGSWARFAAQDRTFFDPFNRGGGGPEALSGGVLPATAPYATAPMPAGMPVTANAPGAIANNNPGNLRAVGATTGFRQFNSLQEGWNALDQDLAAKGKEGLNTINSILNKYAPSSENNTDAYAKDVSTRTGYARDAVLDMTDPAVRQQLAQAIAIHEHGAKAMAGAGADVGNTTVGTGGAGSAAMAVPTGMIDPSTAIGRGMEQQLAYQKAALANIIAAARGGDPRNFSFRLAHLVGAMGNNNFGQVQGQGVDAMNQVIGGLAQRQAEVAEQHYQAATDSVPTGTVVGTDPVTHMAVPLTTYGQRPTQIGGMPTPYDTTPQKSKPKEGDTGKTQDGRSVVYRNGQWVVPE